MEEEELSTNVIPQPIDTIAPSSQEMRKFRVLETELIYSQPTTNRRFHFLIIVGSAEVKQIHQCPRGFCWKVMLLQGNN